MSPDEPHYPNLARQLDLRDHRFQDMRLCPNTVACTNQCPVRNYCQYYWQSITSLFPLTTLLDGSVLTNYLAQSGYSVRTLRIKHESCKRAASPTDLVPQHAFQPVLSGSGDVDGQRGPAVHHRHGSSGQEVVCHLDYDLSTQIYRPHL